MKNFYKRTKSRLFRNQNSISGINSIRDKVNLEWWQEKINLGDELSPIVVEWILKKKGIDCNKKLNGTKHLLAIGSVIGMSNFNATVWGSGIHCLKSIVDISRQAKYRKLDIRSVRGPFTRDALLSCGYNCPEIYGDPAILMPLLYQGTNNTIKKYPFTYIPHITQQHITTDIECNILDIKTRDYKKFIDEILASEKIISSSLHGLILAESYGIPAVFLKVGMEKQIYKYLDWYFSTGRYDIRMANSLKEAMEMKYMNLPKLSSMQDKLLDVFPYELWDE